MISLHAGKLFLVLLFSKLQSFGYHWHNFAYIEINIIFLQNNSVFKTKISTRSHSKKY